jgi:hypothetical protein
MNNYNNDDFGLCVMETFTENFVENNEWFVTESECLCELCDRLEAKGKTINETALIIERLAPLYNVPLMAFLDEMYEYDGKFCTKIVDDRNMGFDGLNLLILICERATQRNNLSLAKAVKLAKRFVSLFGKK